MKRIVMLLTTFLVVFFSGIKSFAAINLPRPIVQLPQNQEKIRCEMRFKEGEKYFLRFVTEQKISQTISGQQQNIEQAIGIGCDLDVKKVEPDGNALMSCTYSWANLKQTGVGGKLIYDSSDKAAPVPAMAQGFAALLDEDFSVKITPLGRVEDVMDIRTLRDNVGKKLPEGPMKEALKVGIIQFINAEGIKEWMENYLAIYPEKPVGIGDSWKRTLTLTRGDSMTVENEWSLKDRKDGVLFVEVKSSIKSNPKAMPVGMGSAKVSYDLSGTQQGQIEFEESTGRLIRSRTNQDISGQINVEVPGKQTQQPPIPVRINGIVTCEMAKRNDVKPVLNANEVVVTDPNDPNAIMDRIRAFEGLEEELQNVEQQSDNEIREWLNGLEGIDTDTVKVVYEQVGAEFDFIRKLADEETADKTITALDGVILSRIERFDKIVEKIQQDSIRREERESRRPGRTRRGTRGRTGDMNRTGTRDSGYNSRRRYPDTGRQDRRRRFQEDMTNRPSTSKITIKMPFNDPNKVKAALKAFEGLGQELKNIERMGVREMRGWTRSQAVTSSILAKAVYKQVEDELKFTRKFAVEEKAAKTTVAIDGLLVSRKERLDRLAKAMLEERRRLLREERRPGRIGPRR